MNVRFETDLTYYDRKSKARYVWNKYESILTGAILDVGADAGFLKDLVSGNVRYTTAGLEPNHDIRVNLENPIPVESGSYDCVLCLDVLEHVENLHQLFDETCRITRRYVIISLPNAWSDFVRVLRAGYMDENRPLKYHYLPPEPPPDRHRWFFSSSESKRFLEIRGSKNSMSVVQIDRESQPGLRKRFFRLVLPLFLHPSIPVEDLLDDGIWAVLEKV